MSRIEELKAQVAKLAEQAKAKALTEEEQEIAALHEQAKAHREAVAAADAARRADDLQQREEAARASAGGRYLVEGVDLVALFPLGKAPMEPDGKTKLPCRGVIIVRSPEQEAAAEFHREAEHKSRNLAALALDLVLKSTVDPRPDTDEHLTLASFFKAYPDAAINVGGKVRSLGGAKATEDKRGRT